MDVLTHIFLPFAAFYLLKRPIRQCSAAAVGGLAPDLDILWGWASHLDESLYPLVHRGFSHTLWGAPLLATLVLFLLTRQPLRRRWRFFKAFAWTPDALTPLWVGAWSHVVLDSLTITGTPALWPFDEARYTTDWFFFGVPFLLPVSIVCLIQVLRGKATPRLAVTGVVLILILVSVAGGIRVATYPRDAPAGADVTPGPFDWVWYVSEEFNETTGEQCCRQGVYTTRYEWGSPASAAIGREHERLAEAASAIGDCKATDGYVAWSWALWGLPIIRAAGTGDGGWRVEFADSAIYFDQLEPLLPWQAPAEPTLEIDTDRDAHCVVGADGRVDFSRDHGWLGS